MATFSTMSNDKHLFNQIYYFNAETLDAQVTKSNDSDGLHKRQFHAIKTNVTGTITDELSESMTGDLAREVYSQDVMNNKHDCLAQALSIVRIIEQIQAARPAARAGPIDVIVDGSMGAAAGDARGLMPRARSSIREEVYKMFAFLVARRGCRRRGRGPRRCRASALGDSAQIYSAGHDFKSAADALRTEIQQLDDNQMIARVEAERQRNRRINDSARNQSDAILSPVEGRRRGHVGPDPSARLRPTCALAATGTARARRHGAAARGGRGAPARAAAVAAGLARAARARARPRRRSRAGGAAPRERLAWLGAAAGGTGAAAAARGRRRAAPGGGRRAAWAAAAAAAAAGPPAWAEGGAGAASIEERSSKTVSMEQLAGAVSGDTPQVESLVFPEWFLGDWACAAELFRVDEGGGDLMLANAVPGAQEALLASRSALGASSAVRREQRRWSRAPSATGTVGTIEIASDAPSGVWAVARALAGPQARVTFDREAGPAEGLPSAWTVLSPGGRQWRVRPDGAAVGEQDLSREERYRAKEFFRADAVVAPVGMLGSALVRVDTVYRTVPPDQTPTGLFKIGMGAVDGTRPFVIQAIQTASVLPPPRRSDGQSAGVALAAYKTRLVFSPIIPAQA
ncbi:unnamed protein product [Prorocentrum cordatum]|uniref:Uncharacterized protein n=1 Tax=Prorocentrum cordatum TaxID=2364126 RepID=A0ABN9SHN7_9DINO|nr:unnamed protein product [Polarella glacialis]